MESWDLRFRGSGVQGSLHLSDDAGPAPGSARYRWLFAYSATMDSRVA